MPDLLKPWTPICSPFHFPDKPASDPLSFVLQILLLL